MDLFRKRNACFCISDNKTNKGPTSCTKIFALFELQRWTYRFIMRYVESMSFQYPLKSKTFSYRVICFLGVFLTTYVRNPGINEKWQIYNSDVSCYSFPGLNFTMSLFLYIPMISYQYINRLFIFVNVFCLKW